MGQKITQATAQIGSCAGRDQSELLGVIRMLARQVPYLPNIRGSNCW